MNLSFLHHCVLHSTLGNKSLDLVQPSALYHDHSLEINFSYRELDTEYANEYRNLRFGSFVFRETIESPAIKSVQKLAITENHPLIRVHHIGNGIKQLPLST